MNMYVDAQLEIRRDICTIFLPDMALTLHSVERHPLCAPRKYTYGDVHVEILNNLVSRVM